jgi:hypothetical protein
MRVSVKKYKITPSAEIQKAYNKDQINSLFKSAAKANNLELLLFDDVLQTFVIRESDYRNFIATATSSGISAYDTQTFEMDLNDNPNPNPNKTMIVAFWGVLGFGFYKMFSK